MLSYNAKKYIKKEMIVYGIFAVIGVVFFILGTFFDILKEEMPVLCTVFIVIGVVGAALTSSMKKTPEKTERIVRIKTEERLQFVRYKAGYNSFWVMFIYISISTIFSRYIQVSISMFLSITIAVMAVVLLISSIVQHKIS